MRRLRFELQWEKAPRSYPFGSKNGWPRSGHVRYLHKIEFSESALGPLNAKSKEEDVVSREKLAYYKKVNAIVSCTTGAIVALVLYKLMRYIVNQATSKPNS